MNTLPLPVRLAAGLVATAVEGVRDLPRLVLELPVTAVSQALQASMRVQQRVTELAIKGDRVLGTLRPVEEKPSWATFDEDEPPRRNGASAVTELRPQAARSAARIPEPELPIEDESPAAAAVTQVAARTTAEAAGGGPVVHVSGTDDAGPASGPNAMPSYQHMTIPQLRGKLRHLDLEDLNALLAWETSHQNRPPFVTMLTNRITTVNGN